MSCLEQLSSQQWPTFGNLAILLYFIVLICLQNILDVFPRIDHPLLHQALTQNISAVLANLPREPGQEKSPVRVGFITYAQQIHYYNLNPNLAQPGMLVSHIRPDSSQSNPQW